MTDDWIISVILSSFYKTSRYQKIIKEIILKVLHIGNYRNCNICVTKCYCSIHFRLEIYI